MQMRPDIQIQSVLKSLTDIVLPAIDPHNKLAQEQSRLCIGLLALMAQQLPIQFRFDCDELARLIDLAGRLRSSVPDSELAAVQRRAEDVLSRAKATPDDVLLSVRELRSATSAVVTRAYEDSDAATVERVQTIVLATSKEQLLRDRSAMLMQNWESDSKAIPPLSQLLA